jgi:predicted RecA/RadA family phage recombinase
VPVNECIPWYEDSDRLPCEAFTAVTGKRFVIPAAARLSGPMIPATAQVGASDPTDGGDIRVGHAAAAGAALGVSSWDAAVGEKVTVICEGVVPVTAGAALTAGQRVEVGANGTAVPLAAGIAVGIAVDSTANGADAQIKLIQ